MQLQAVALAEALATTHPNDQSVLHTQFKSQLDLAKSYRWSAENRAKTPATVDKGMELLEKVNSQSLPQWETKAYLTLQIASLKVAVHSLSKDYETAFKLSTELLEKTKPMLTDEKTTSHQIALLATSYYQHAFLLEKLGKKEEAQAQLQKLIDMLDKSLVKFPNDPTLLRDKKGYEKYKGKEIK